MHTYQHVSLMPVSAEALYAWHASPGAFLRLAPPWETMADISRQGALEDGAETRFTIRKGPLGVRWVARHDQHVADRQFRDVQVAGPFSVWRHTHRFVPVGPGESRLEDSLEVEAPGGPVATWLGGSFLNATLSRMFQFRHRRTRDDLARHARYAAVGRRRILVSGASGLVGQALVAFLQGGGHDVVRLVRRAPGPGEIHWDPEKGEIRDSDLEGFDAVIHLAGEGIAEGRWTAARKARILQSRVDGTRLLATAIARLDRKPEAFISASAIGFYGDRGDEGLDESAAAGQGFLADVCRAWEAETAPAGEAGVRVVNLRIGIVLTPQGGALARMLPPFQLGAGGPVGSGRQYMSWIALDDLLGAIQHVLFTPSLRGPVNATAPEPARSSEFARVLGHVLHRPAILPLPEPAVWLMLGEMGRALLLEGARVLPTKLQQSGFQFLCPTLEEALRHEIGLVPAEAA
ncbi:MAG: TIGR01777 family oxidoreductase [Candidatus Sericytochromatia bacterium]|nr:TIGR01777 family oxidoreductase [Candidatus Sericytochromatia bacterium]